MNTPTTQPPHDLTAEACVLGAILLDPDALPEVMTILTGAEAFWLPRNEAVYRAMLQLSSDNSPVSADALISALTNHRDFATPKEVENHLSAALGENGRSQPTHFARIVAEKHRLRLLDLAAQNMSASILMGLGDSGDIAGKASDEMSKAVSGGKAALISMTDAFGMVLAQLQSRKPAFMSTPFKAFDAEFGGIPDGACCTLMGTPGSGKTTLCIQLLAHLADQGVPVLLYSNEQTPMRIAATLLSQRSGLPIHDRLGRGSATLAEEQAAMEAAANCGPMPIFQCSQSLNAREIYAQAKLCRQRGVRVVYVDYLQQLAPLPGMNNEAERIGESMRLLQAITRDMGMTTIVVSQIDKATSKGTTHAGDAKRRPTMFDGVGSGKIEQFSDCIYSVFRPHMHDPVDENDIEGWKYRRSITEFSVLKAKFGPCGSVSLRFNAPTMEFYE